MPLYEYHCAECGRRYSALVGMTAEPDDERCPSCGEVGTKLVSRFRRGRHEDERLDEMADQMEFRGEPESASEMRQWVRELGKGLDEDASDEMEEMLELDLAEEE